MGKHIQNSQVMESTSRSINRLPEAGESKKRRMG
jgi:hypothetical protein